MSSGNNGNNKRKHRRNYNNQSDDSLQMWQNALERKKTTIYILRIFAKIPDKNFGITHL